MPNQTTSRPIPGLALALLLLCAPIHAGGPTFHFAAALEGLQRIQDPELRALLRIDEIVELPTPWDAADHYSTLRLAEAGGRLFLLGRAFDGIQTWVFDPNTSWQKISFASPALSDLQGWDQAQYYETIRVETIGDDLYLLARGADAVWLSRLDTSTLTWESLPALNAMSSFDQVQYYSTIRTEVVGDDLYLFARGANSVSAYRFDTATETWQTLPSVVSLTDAGGWNLEQYYSTIRTEVVGDVVYLLARGSTGIVTLTFDTLTESWGSLPTYAVMTDAGGWDDGPYYYSTLRTVVVGDDIHLLGRASTAVVLHRLDTATESWQALPSVVSLTDAGDWNLEQFYSTIRTEVVDDVVYLLARGSTGIVTLTFDTLTLLLKSKRTDRSSGAPVGECRGAGQTHASLSGPGSGRSGTLAGSLP